MNFQKQVLVACVQQRLLGREICERYGITHYELVTWIERVFPETKGSLMSLRILLGCNPVVYDFKRRGKRGTKQGNI